MQKQMAQEEEINLLEYWQVLCKRKKLIFRITVITTVAVAVLSLFMTNIYEATAVITTASDQDSSGLGAAGMLSASGLAGLAGMAGISLPGGQNLTELEQFLKSNAVRGEIIANNDLLPVLFYKQWDAEKKEWKKSRLAALGGALTSLVKSVMPKDNATSKLEDDGNPTLWDGLRSFDEMVDIKNNTKANTLTISFDYPDPKIAARIVSDILETLQDHLSEEKKRNAYANKKYLQEQLVKAADPMVRQKIYALLSQQVETALMAEVKGNIFKIIDPPKVPDKKIRPKRALMVILAMIMSLFVGVFLAFFLEYLEKMKAANAGGIETEEGDGNREGKKADADSS